MLADPAFADKNIIKRGLIPAGSSPEEFAALIQRDRAIAVQVIKDANMELR